MQNKSTDTAATWSIMVELVETVYEGEPAVNLVVNSNVVKTYVNRAGMSMLMFMKYVANDNDYEIDYLEGNTAVCY